MSAADKAKTGHLKDGPLLFPRKTSQEISEKGLRKEAWERFKKQPAPALNWGKK